MSAAEFLLFYYRYIMTINSALNQACSKTGSGPVNGTSWVLVDISMKYKCSKFHHLLSLPGPTFNFHS